MTDKDKEMEKEWDQPWRPEEAEGDWEWNEEDFHSNEDQVSPSPLRGWTRRFIIVIVAIALLGNVLAVIPLIYNSNVFQFLKVTSELSQRGDLQTYKEAIVVVTADGSKGTGFNIDKQGLIVTNQHVVGDAKTAVIGFSDDTIFHADVVERDPDADLALLRLQNPPDRELPVLTVDSQSSWTPDMTIYYIGNPLFFSHIMGKGKVLELINIDSKPMPVLLLDAPIYKGNSGSPVLTENGQVIGVIYATTEITRNGNTIDAGLAIPTNHRFFQ